MRRVMPVLVLLGLGLVWAAPDFMTVAADRGSDDRIIMEDDCDPRDPEWNTVGGCHLKRGTVDLAEFRLYSASAPPLFLSPPEGTPLADAVIGHPSWRNDPGYLVMERGKRLEVRNYGGREHTFTQVNDYGGGVVPPLNFGLAVAPECPLALPGGIVPAGERIRLEDLPVGSHKFQCCFHPWMRSLVKVTARR